MGSPTTSTACSPGAGTRSRSVGQLLDPIADRLYVFAALLAFGIREIVPWWLVGLLVLRDVVLALTLPTLKRLGYTGLPVHFLGKAATANLLASFPLAAARHRHLDVRGVGRTPSAGPSSSGGPALYWWAALGYLWQVRSLVRDARTAAASDRARRRAVMTGP